MVGDGVGEEGETAGSGLGAVYSCTCVVGGGGGGGGVEGVVGEEENYVIFFKRVLNTFGHFRTSGRGGDASPSLLKGVGERSGR